MNDVIRLPVVLPTAPCFLLTFSVYYSNMFIYHPAVAPYTIMLVLGPLTPSIIIYSLCLLPFRIETNEKEW